MQVRVPVPANSIIDYATWHNSGDALLLRLPCGSELTLELRSLTAFSVQYAFRYFGRTTDTIMSFYFHERKAAHKRSSYSPLLPPGAYDEILKLSRMLMRAYRGEGNCRPILLKGRAVMIVAIDMERIELRQGWATHTVLFDRKSVDAMFEHLCLPDHIQLMHLCLTIWAALTPTPEQAAA